MRQILSSIRCPNVSNYLTTDTLDVLLGSPFQRVEEQPAAPNEMRHAQELFHSWQVLESEAFKKTCFHTLRSGLPPETVRGKGYVHFSEFPATRFLFQMVGKRASVIPSGDWGQKAPKTELVFIALRSPSQTGADYSLK
jgi:G3E family GTPase